MRRSRFSGGYCRGPGRGSSSFSSGRVPPDPGRAWLVPPPAGAGSSSCGPPALPRSLPMRTEPRMRPKRLADRLALELLLQHIAELPHGLPGLSGAAEHALDLGPEARMGEGSLDAHRDGKTCQRVGAAFGSCNDLGLGQEIHGPRHHVDGAARRHLEQRARHLQVVQFGDTARDREAAAKCAELGLGARALLQIWHAAGADARDQLGQVDALDRAVGNVQAALAANRLLDLFGRAAAAGQLQLDPGAAGDEVESGGAVEQRLHRDIVQHDVAGEGWHGLGAIQRELAAALPLVKLHRGQVGVEHAVAQAEAERARPDHEPRPSGLVDVHIDVGVEGSRHDHGRLFGLRLRRLTLPAALLARPAPYVELAAPPRPRWAAALGRFGRFPPAARGRQAWPPAGRNGSRIRLSMASAARRCGRGVCRLSTAWPWPVAWLKAKRVSRESDLAGLPGDVARQLAGADRSLGRRLLAHPGEDRRHRLRLGGHIAFEAEDWLGRDRAHEIRGDRFGGEAEIEPRRAALEVSRRGQRQVEADRYALPIEIALGGQGIDEMRQAERSIDVLDAPLVAAAVIDDAHRAILDADVVQHDVAARRATGGISHDEPHRRRSEIARRHTEIALLLGVAPSPRAAASAPAAP